MNELNVSRSLNSPARKTFVKDLKNLPENCLVWIQGYVNRLNSAGNVLHLTDGSGQIAVTSISSSTDEATWISAEYVDKYYMVVGFLCKSQQEVSVEAVKVVDISSNANLQMIWINEINHLRARNT